MNIPWGQLELLADPTRRALYEHVRRAGDRGSGREQAADAVGISRGLAAFHLDKLVAAGLLSAAYEAPAPRGRGRAPKIYRAADREIDFSLPHRRYDLMGEILADGIDAAPADARDAALRAAFRRGHAEGDAARRAGGRLERLLDRLGFEPEQGGRPGATGIGVRLRNCPFQRLAARHTELVCGINQAFLAGILQGLGVSSLSATLAPTAGLCCVRLAPQRT
ncbi:MAG TPA: helix-turn-helix domain-containing protein [Streptosporangiaceae bacterium]